MTDNNTVQIRRALISVADKRGLLPFAAALRAMGVTIISTGGTLAALRDAGIDARAVAEVTGFPEILDGRVKTLHPKIYGGLLARSDLPLHQEQIATQGIESIDLVVVNLYPFGETVARPGVTADEAIEQIDIGGPSMLRAAAKNHLFKAAVVNPDHYTTIIEEMKSRGGALSGETRRDLARDVFHHTAAYDAAIGAYFDRTYGGAPAFSTTVHLDLHKVMDLRYGENPHQRAALYGDFSRVFAPLHGKELSFNNIVDLSAAALLVAEFDEPTVAIIKHTNPCGVGSAQHLAEAYARALATDPKSSFGGIIACNRPLDLETAASINEMFTEAVIAPEFPPPVLALLRKKKDRRLVQIRGDVRALHQLDVRSIPGGYLLQDADQLREGQAEQFRVVTRRKPTDDEQCAMRFAWRVAKHVKSNAIVYTRADRTLGIGAGQMSRVDSAKIATMKAKDAGLDLDGCAVGSDAFFPFADGLLEAVRAGATAVIQPGGSVRDAEVVAAADEHDIAMVFTGTRHFRH
jgi:phosphoribosylaminoimidazolecarboxamide formyltransferase / IMP cyclohydrolase